MQRVLAHIDAHPDGDLGIEALSAVAAFSKFHFARQFSELFGIAPALRAARADAAGLVAARAPWRHGITELAFDSGFETPEGFSRAFRRHTGRTPSEFRDEPVLPAHEESPRMPTEAEVRIVDFPATPVAVLEHRGDPRASGKPFVPSSRGGSASACRRPTAPPSTSSTATSTSTSARRRIGPIAPNPEGVRAGLIPGGRCAVLRHLGPAEDLRWAGRFLYAEWLPASGEELRDFPLFVQRVRFHPEVPQHEAVTDVFLPLR
jgi:AraC family transcriptional regulator